MDISWREARFWRMASMIAGATVGDGVFALPYVFIGAGWALSLIYLAVLGVMIVAAHMTYFETLRQVGERERLLGLVRHYFGEGGFWVGFGAIVFGLLFGLVAYLILGVHFLQLGFPGMPQPVAVLLFWLFLAAIALLSDAELSRLEIAGIAGTAAVIFTVFLSALPNLSFGIAPSVNPAKLFLPFGAVLFSLAGWTGVEPAYESEKKLQKKTSILRPLATGTLAAALLYALFVVGILSTTGTAAPDTISGLGAWPMWKRDLVAVLGLLAVATVSMPLSREVKNALQKDLGWGAMPSRLLIIFFPITCFLLGFSNFLLVVSVVGGIFLGVQYVFIVAVGRRALKLSRMKAFLLDVVGAVFGVLILSQIAAFFIG